MTGNRSYRPVRRQDRILDQAAARALLERGEYGFLALCDPDTGGGYGVPLSYVVEGERIYFHAAPEGHKLDAIRRQSRASFCVVGSTSVGTFTTAYESALVFGSVHVVEPDPERHKALVLLARKYNPELADQAEKYIARSFERTAVLRFDIEHLTGKCKRLPGASAPSPPVEE